MRETTPIAEGLFTVALLLSLSACATLGSGNGTQVTQLMKSEAVAKVSAAELRYRIDDAVPRFIGAVEAAADRIRTDSTDPVVRRRALEWKVEAVQAVQIAAFQTDLTAAALDLWLLTVQMDEAFSEGAASTWFGSGQSIAAETAAGLREMVEGYAAEIAHDESSFERARSIIHETARRYPVDAHVSTRTSIVTIIGTVEGQTAVGSIASVRSVADSVAEISNHLNAYVSALPKLGRWQAELLTEDLAVKYELVETVDDVREAADVIESADALAPDAITRVTDTLREAFSAERAAILLDIDRQRTESLAAIRDERIALLNAIATERQAAMEAVRQERLETTESVEQMRKSLVDDASVHAVALVDHLILRLIEVLAGLAVIVLASVTLLRRFRRAA